MNTYKVGQKIKFSNGVGADTNAIILEINEKEQTAIVQITDKTWMGKYRFPDGKRPIDLFTITSVEA
jgi:hypothetical protein